MVPRTYLLFVFKDMGCRNVSFFSFCAVLGKLSHLPNLLCFLILCCLLSQPLKEKSVRVTYDFISGSDKKDLRLSVATTFRLQVRSAFFGCTSHCSSGTLVWIAMFVYIFWYSVFILISAVTWFQNQTYAIKPPTLQIERKGIGIRFFTYIMQVTHSCIVANYYI